MPESSKTEWLHEAGIGEERAILVKDGRIVAARIEWAEGLRPGLVAEAAIVARTPGSKRGTARFRDGSEALVDGLTADVTEGQTVMLGITRAAIAERGRTKLAQARPSKLRPCAAPTLLEELQSGALPVRSLPAHDRAFDGAGWDELIEEALTGTVDFAGGSLCVSPTPAMTLIDVDGALPPKQLALAAIPAIADALGRLDLGGSVGIDFPSIEAKADRQAADMALAEALAGWPKPWNGERTAMNGFGFVQLVSRLERPSLVALYARRPAAAAVRMLLRRAERVAEPGVLLLTARPAVHNAVRPEWEAELTRRTCRQVRWQEDAGLALAGGFAQAVPQ